jgi:hypothetical protein
MKLTTSWYVAPCSLVEVYRRFRAACCLRPHGSRGAVCMEVKSDCWLVLNVSWMLWMLSEVVLQSPNVRSITQRVLGRRLELAPCVTEGSSKLVQSSTAGGSSVCRPHIRHDYLAIRATARLMLHNLQLGGTFFVFPSFCVLSSFSTCSRMSSTANKRNCVLLVSPPSAVRWSLALHHYYVRRVTLPRSCGTWRNLLTQGLCTLRSFVTLWLTRYLLL